MMPVRKDEAGAPSVRFYFKEDTPMNKTLFRGSLGLMLALMLVLSALPLSALAAESENSDFTLIELQGTDVTLDETVFEYTGSEIRPNVTVRAGGQLLTLDQDYTLRYENNLEAGTATVIVTGIATASESVGYSGTVEIPFYINEKTPEFTLVEIKGTDVIINGTEFSYTGAPIEPAVTVTIDGKTLTPGQDYAIEYINNLVPGTGTVIVRGIATASEAVGYTGEVRMDFTILPITEEQYPLTEIKTGDVTIEGTRFDYTGSAIEPKVTVTVDGKVLTQGKDYSLHYENNIQAGTATAIIRGIATATETGGYTGEVTVSFSIVEVPTPGYAVTKGDGATWNQGSSTTLSFTADGPFADFIGITINGKTVDKDYYSVKEGSTIVTLKNSFLNKLSTGKYSITLHFEDGDATGLFYVAAEEDSSNPKTGDDFPLRTLSAVMFISLTALAGSAFAYFKKLRK